MSSDPIVDELHQPREERMKQFKYDFNAFCRYLREQEKLSDEPTLAPPTSPPSTTVQRTRVARR